MLLAAAMSPTAQAILFTLAVVAFLVAALLILARSTEGWLAPALVALGLALFVFPYCWNAWSAV